MTKLWTMFAVVCAIAPLAVGCAPEDDDPPPATPMSTPDTGEQDDNNTEGQDDVATGECEAEAVRSCKVQINARNCFVGEQVCDGGVWGDCLEPDDDGDDD